MLHDYGKLIATIWLKSKQVFGYAGTTVVIFLNFTMKLRIKTKAKLDHSKV